MKDNLIFFNFRYFIFIWVGYLVWILIIILKNNKGYVKYNFFGILFALGILIFKGIYFFYKFYF